MRWVMCDRKESSVITAEWSEWSLYQLKVAGSIPAAVVSCWAVSEKEDLTARWLYIILNKNTLIREYKHYSVDLDAPPTPSQAYTCAPVTFWTRIFSQTSSVSLMAMSVCCSVSRSTTLLQTDISQQLLDGLPWNFVEAIIIPRWWRWWSPEFSSSVVLGEL